MTCTFLWRRESTWSSVSNYGEMYPEEHQLFMKWPFLAFPRNPCYFCHPGIWKDCTFKGWCQESFWESSSAWIVCYCWLRLFGYWFYWVLKKNPAYISIKKQSSIAPEISRIFYLWCLTRSWWDFVELSKWVQWQITPRCKGGTGVF